MGLWNFLYSKAERRLTKEAEVDQFPLSDFQRLRHEIKPCDVVLVEGLSKVADVIKTITQSSWSHAALYIGRLHDISDPRIRQKVKSVYDGQPDEQLIVESQLGLGTVIRPLHVYEGRHLRICRPHELSFQDAQKILNFAILRLGTEYDLRAIMDLARFYLPWTILPRKWRSSLFNYSPGDSTQTVCSTMIAEAFASVHYPVLPLVKRIEDGNVRVFHRNPKLHTPSDFDYSPYFDIIKYPFMSFDGSGTSRFQLMPWEGEAELSKEEALMYLDSSETSKLREDRFSFRRSIDEKENF